MIPYHAGNIDSTFDILRLCSVKLVLRRRVECQGFPLGVFASVIWGLVISVIK